MNFSKRTPTNNIQKVKAKQQQGSIIGSRISKKPIIHRIFEDAADYADDIYWKERLLLAARNEFGRKNITYTDGLLKKIKKTGYGEVEIPQDDPEEAMYCFIEFYKKHDGVLSKTDKEEIKEKLRLAAEEKIVLEWDRCNKKMKCALIIDYCERMQVRYEFSDGTKEILILTLSLLVSHSLLSEREVAMKDNQVNKITEVIYDRENGVFSLTEEIKNEIDKKLADKKKKTPKSKKVNPSDVSNAWENSLNYRKEMMRKQK